MPVYTFKNNETDEEVTMEMSYNDLKKYIEDNPNMEQIFKMNVVDPVGIGVTKPPSDFSKYVLGKVKEKHPKGSVEKRWTINKEI